MGRKKISAAEKFTEAVEELGIEKAQAFLDMFKRIWKKKSLGTDPDPKAGERLNEPPNTTPTE